MISDVDDDGSGTIGYEERGATSGSLSGWPRMRGYAEQPGTSQLMVPVAVHSGTGATA